MGVERDVALEWVEGQQRWLLESAETIAGILQCIEEYTVDEVRAAIKESRRQPRPGDIRFPNRMREWLDAARPQADAHINKYTVPEHLRGPAPPLERRPLDDSTLAALGVTRGYQEGQ